MANIIINNSTSNQRESATQLLRIIELASSIKDILEENSAKLATAESCTGGLVAAALVQIPGISAVLDRSFVAYSAKAKSEMLDVDPKLISKYTAVSYEVATAMARGAAKNAGVDSTIAVTGYAGADGAVGSGDLDGLVYIAVYYKGEVSCLGHRFSGDRSAVILGATATALERFLEFVSEYHNIIN